MSKQLLENIFCNDESLYFYDSKVRFFAKYWNKVRGNNIVPRRQDFDPIDIISILPFIEMYKIDGDGNLDLILSGNEVYERTGGNVRGTSYFDMLVPEQREFVRQSNIFLHSIPCGETALLLEGNPGLLKRVVETISLPLLNNDSDEVERIVVITVDINPDLIEVTQEPSELDRYIFQQFLDLGNGVPDMAFSDWN